MTVEQLLTFVAQAQKTTPGDGGAFMRLLFPILAIVFLFYLLILRPQKRQEQERKRMLSALNKGDKVVTIGGIYGTIVDIDENTDIITLEVAKNVRIDFTRSAVSQVIKSKKQSQ